MHIPLGRFTETTRVPTRGYKRITTHRLWFPSIAAEIRFIRKGIDKWRGRVWTRKLAVSLIRNVCAEKDQLCQAMTIAQAVKLKIYYVNERPETFQTPVNTWEFEFGDCDDFTWLIGALIESIGIPVEVDGMKINGKWKHVFPVAIIRRPGAGAYRLTLDATLNAPVGPNADPVRIALSKGLRVETYRLKSKTS